MEKETITACAILDFGDVRIVPIAKMSISHFSSGSNFYFQIQKQPECIIIAINRQIKILRVSGEETTEGALLCDLPGAQSALADAYTMLKLAQATPTRFEKS